MAFIGRTDAPQKEAQSDRLQTDLYAHGLAKFVQTCETPLTVGIQGEWGSGKTSLMRMVESRLRFSDKLLISWFDTWQYGAIDDDEGLGVQLLIDLSRALTRDLLDNAKAQRISSKIQSLLHGIKRLAKQTARTVGSAVAAGTVNQFTSLIDGGTLVAAIGGGALETEDPPLSTIKSAFEELVREYVLKVGGADAGGRVVVFVDDLDRIRPGRAVALLEILKNFLDVEHCVFVIACDHDVVREGVRERLGIVASDKVDAFFHKLFQVPFQMPVDTYDNTSFLKDYIQGLLPATGKGKGAKNSDRAQEIADRINAAVTASVGTNPRALKRFFNISDLMLCVDENRSGNASAASTALDRSDDVKLGVYLTLVAMHSRWPNVAAYLARLKSTSDFDRAFATLLADSELSDEQADEELEGLLQATYAESLKDSSQWRRSTEVERLNRFARCFQKSLSRFHQGGSSQFQGLRVAQALLTSMRLVANSAETRYQTPFFRFRESALAISNEVGDAFFGIVRALDARFGRDSRFTILRTDSRYSLQINNSHGPQLAPMALYIKDDSAGSGGRSQLLLRTNLGRKAASGVLCAEQLVKLGELFVGQTAGLGAEWTPNGEGFRLDFMQKRVPQASMDLFRDAILELHEKCAQAVASSALQHRDAQLTTGQQSESAS